MTFDNLVFLKHPNDAFEGLMAKYRFDNGKELSVVAGNNLYCTTKYGTKKGGPLLEVSDVLSWEVMIGGRVEGWQTKEDINKLIKENNGR
tara:strand:- start:16 stop:285 length:270 start_codon:yes stop_codon:yes gene_type:complete